MAEPSASLVIDVVSDVVCPWCFIGKRRLAAALAQRADVAVTVNWRPFQLDPTIPSGGIDRKEYLRRKFGDDERIAALHDNVRAAAADTGIAFRFEAIERSPNTLDAHRLIRWAQPLGRQDAVVERLFSDYFLAGRDIGDHVVLTEAAASGGLDPAEVAARLATEEDKDAVREEIATAARLGISGVPFFIFDGRYGVSGAQAPETLVEVIDKTLAG
ncbi:MULTISPECIES: DsbA family oxidoreductase [unclassified Chelatococcus]|uniref:DsbA family oxidoreductase n=1 Tax=unclassified Chelatococcus TaxID=2638111 RepID=UPI0002DB9EDB|nr:MULTISPECIES: DsbA family oxidoreductase [unclassified Chelatococcus]ALA18856.1 disulfide bond formation protein DsbA [Chelatococcus sp. CO-6]